MKNCSKTFQRKIWQKKVENPIVAFDQVSPTVACHIIKSVEVGAVKKSVDTTIELGNVVGSPCVDKKYFKVGDILIPLALESRS